MNRIEICEGCGYGCIVLTYRDCYHFFRLCRECAKQQGFCLKCRSKVEDGDFDFELFKICSDCES
jgi:hypothetical protein